MEHMEFCAGCLLAYLVVSKSITNRRKLHPIRFVESGWWWDGSEGGGEGKTIGECGDAQ